ncbi:MAG: hypothetical protein FWF50_00240 [Defluviitaleaceae bacterium]|nr:hypothetical protein [Defluviitaleaceae bacterium]
MDKYTPFENVTDRPSEVDKIVMITKGLKGRKDLDRYHEACKKALDDFMYKNGYIHLKSELNDGHAIPLHQTYITTGEITDFKHIENFDYSNPKHRLQSLINTLQSELMIADLVVFFDNWYDFSGCNIEHEICKQYGIKIEYLSSNSEAITESSDWLENTEVKEAARKIEDIDACESCSL